MGKSSSALDHESPPLGAYPRERLPSAADCKDRQIVVVDADGTRSVVFSDGTEWKHVGSGAADATYTAAQLAALAAAGGLTPFATYVASDTGVAGFASDASTLNPGINADGDIESPTGALYALSEVTEYVTLTASGLAFTGPCEVGGWYCSVAAGTIAIYDALSETGTPFVPATTLVAGPMPIMGAGTRGVIRFTTGCYVKLSGAATVRVLVGA